MSPLGVSLIVSCLTMNDMPALCALHKGSTLPEGGIPRDGCFDCSAASALGGDVCDLHLHLLHLLRSFHSATLNGTPFGLSGRL